MDESANEEREDMGEAALQIDRPSTIERILFPKKVKQYIAHKESLIKDAEEKTKEIDIKIKEKASLEEIKAAFDSACLAIKKAQKHIR